MVCKHAKSILSAEKRVLASENESQDSQEQLVKHMLTHGVGVLSSSAMVIDHPYQLNGNTAISNKEPTNISHICHSLEELEEPELVVIKQSQIASDASNALAQSNVAINFPDPHINPKSDSIHIQPALDDATSVVQRPSQLIENDALPTRATSSTLKEKVEKMSSDSPTQSNDGRSYEQYEHENSQPQSSSQASGIHEYRTLQENDTGFLNFGRAQHDISDSAQEEAETNVVNNRSERSGLESQAHGASNHDASAPETPSIAQRVFQHSRDSAQLMAPSQLFGQTQWTSTVKKPTSPTSSRPSPDVFNQIMISPNPIVSSPLKNKGIRTSPTHAFTSSPAFPGISSRPSDGKTPSAPTDTHEDEVPNQGSAEETPLPHFRAPKRRAFLEPIGEYKSLRQHSSETDVNKSPSQSDGEQDSESEADVAARRRHLAKLGRERATKSFPAISLPRSSLNKGDNVEVPSTSRINSTKNRRRADSEQYVVQCHGKAATDDHGSQETVADSQEVAGPPKSTETNPKASGDSDEQEADDKNSHTDDLPSTEPPESNVEYRETIPETSPPGTSIELPKLLGDIMKQHSSIRSEIETVSFPTLSGGTDPEQQQKEINDSRPSSLPEPLSSFSTKRGRRPGRIRSPLESSPTIVLASSPQSATRRSARLENIVTPSSAGHDSPHPSDIGTRTSTLTSLSTTPTLSTPASEPDRASAGNERQSSSPAAPKVQRQGRLSSSVTDTSSSLPKLRTYSRSRESIRRLTRHSSLSTDELAKSPVSTSSKEERKPPVRKPARQSLANQHLLRESIAKRGIFEGMAFALSFQSGQNRRNKEKSADRATVERMIRQEGGKILSEGFGELFKFDSFQTTSNTSAAQTLSNSLTPLNQDTGFTALIADGHSRKVKYMQALALGIPCLAPKWITNCISKKEVVDWSSYLLCAGPSALLGEAIRSRNLQSYDASTARLVDVINARPKLLDEARILLVMKKTKNEDKRLPYVFLAQVLGGSLVRVYSLEEARAKLRDEESHDNPFDWVYVDDHIHDAQNALFGPSPGNVVSKKRRRQSTGPEDSDRPPKRIRTLNDELVIQSLILGRLIEDGEMEE